MEEKNKLIPVDTGRVIAIHLMILLFFFGGCEFIFGKELDGLIMMGVSILFVTILIVGGAFSKQNKWKKKIN